MMPEREPPPGRATGGRNNRGGRSGASTKPQDSPRHRQPAVMGSDICPEWLAVLDTAHRALDGIVDVSADALLRNEPLTVADLVGPLGRIADRQRCALQAAGVEQ